MESMSLLNMLAEIASEKLQTDPTVRMISKLEETKNNEVQNSGSSDSEYHPNQGKPMTLHQVSNISENNILRLFTVSQANELKRKFYFTCRFLPQHCEETFQSFGSEEKARTQMKKHLKRHLSILLDEFKDLESREKYILRTVSTSKLSNGDAKSSSRKPKRAKADVKPKLNYEKENSKLLTKKLDNLQSSNDSMPAITYNYNISSTSSRDDQLQSFASQKHLPLNTDLKYNAQNFVVAGKHSSVTNDLLSTTYAGDAFVKNVVNDNYKEISEMQVFDPSYQYREPAKMPYNSYERLHNNELSVYVSSSNELPGHSDTSGNNGVLYITPSSNQYLNCSSENYSAPNHDSNPRNVSNEPVKRSVETFTTVSQLSPKKVKMEIIDIKVGDAVKLEVLNSNQPLTEPNSFVSHVGYNGNELNVGSSQDSPVKDVKVEQELIDIWRDFTGDYFIENNERIAQQGTKEIFLSHLESIENPSVSSEPKEIQNANLEEKVSSPGEAPLSKKKRLKGRGKFVGQSKNDRQMALNLIAKIKSHPPMQLDSLECAICNPPRTFTAAATLLSHYKSHAGIRPYVCVHCDAEFTRQHSLNYHYLIHNNQTRFTCNECGRKFRHPSHFKEHLRRHTGESPYECTDCTMRFKTRNTYKRHLRTRHGKKLTSQGPVQSDTEDSKTGVKEVVNYRAPIQNGGQHEEDTILDSQNLNAGSIPEEKINMSVSYISADNSSILPDNSVTKWSNVVFLDTNSKGLEVSDSNNDMVRYSGDNASGNSTYHEMLPLQVSNLNVVDIGSNTSVSFKDSSNVIHNQLYTERETVLPTSAAPLNAVQQQHLPNVLKNDNEYVYIVDKPVSYDESHNFSQNINYNGVGCSSDFYSSAQPSNTGVLSRTTITDIGAVANTPALAHHYYDNGERIPGTSHGIHSNNLSCKSSMDECNDLKHIASGSILGALLTKGSVRGCGSSAPPVKSLEVNVPNGGVKNSDKWDSLMREVVSLSSMAKSREESPPNQVIVHSSSNVKPMKELSNNFHLNRVGNKDISEVYVLKYANGTTGTRIAKVFKATKSSMVAKEVVVERRKENANAMSRKPILITSSIGSINEKNNQKS